MPVTVIDKIKQKSGNFKLMDAVDVETADGKSVEEKFAEIAENGGGRFTGSTEDTTPQEVMEALVAGKTILLNHNSANFGIVFFANFAYTTVNNGVAASVAFENNGVIYNASLIGFVGTETWSFSVNEIAKKADIPEKKIATDVDLSKYESEGIIVETYADGSSLTHTFEFDANGRPTKRTDSNGGETIFTWG